MTRLLPRIPALGCDYDLILQWTIYLFDGYITCIGQKLVPMIRVKKS